VPVVISNAPETSDKPLNITVEVGGEEFNATIDRRADNIRVKAEKQKLGTNRMFV
jgi:hypothetical protein